MSRPRKLGWDSKLFSFVMRGKAWDKVERKSEELSKLTQSQVSAAEIIRLCIDMHLEKTCDEIERRFRAERY
jgi:hypothetical protein